MKIIDSRDLYSKINTKTASAILPLAKNVPKGVKQITKTTKQVLQRAAYNLYKAQNNPATSPIELQNLRNIVIQAQADYNAKLLTQNQATKLFKDFAADVNGIFSTPGQTMTERQLLNEVASLQRKAQNLPPEVQKILVDHANDIIGKRFNINAVNLGNGVTGRHVAYNPTGAEKAWGATKAFGRGARDTVVGGTKALSDGVKGVYNNKLLAYGGGTLGNTVRNQMGYGETDKDRSFMGKWFDNAVYPFTFGVDYATNKAKDNIIEPFGDTINTGLETAQGIVTDGVNNIKRTVADVLDPQTAAEETPKPPPDGRSATDKLQEFLVGTVSPYLKGFNPANDIPTALTTGTLGGLSAGVAGLGVHNMFARDQSDDAKKKRRNAWLLGGPLLGNAAALGYHFANQPAGGTTPPTP